jgi:AmiR/NasT family two-component response regulator
MTTAVIHCRGAAGTPPLADDLLAAGIHVLGAVERGNLVQDVIRLAPDVLVCHDTGADTALLDLLQTLQTHAPRPVLLFTQSADAEAIARAVEVGVHAYVVQGYAAHRLRPLVKLAQARFGADQALRDALSNVTERFEERKLVDRAKGLLMRARQMDEEAAFGVLRAAAMRGGQRIGEAARHVIDAARGAADINRAGQLRMLSQRLVKLAALRVLRGRADEGNAALAESAARAGDTVQGLARELSAATFGDLTGALTQAWASLQQALVGKDAGPLTAAAVLRADSLAEQMLEQSDLLTTALESAGGSPSGMGGLRLVNACGRQRMLSQRVAKHLLLAAVAPTGAAKPGQPAAHQAAARLAREDYERGVAYLEALPLADRDIRAALAAAAAQWQVLLEGGASAHTAGGREAVASASENLLALFDGLTGHYERSLQVLTE